MRIEAIEDKIAVADVRPFSVNYDADLGDYVREGVGHWSGIVTFSEPGIRIFIIEFS